MQKSKHRGSGCLIWLGGLVALVLAVGLLGAIYESVSEAADARAYPAPGQLVDVGGYRLYISCVGSGSPTVIIDAGLGDWSTSWSWVQPEVAKTDHVCIYDRAGYGWSEPGPQPRTVQQFVTELHALLAGANVPGPYVLVGHSLGGLTARLFAHDYQAEVLGLVLIESMNPGPEVSPATDVTTPGRALVSADSITTGLARLGLFRLGAQPLGLVPHLPAEAEKDYLAFSVRPRYFEVFLDETRAIPESMAQAAAVQTLGDLPLIVLSRGLPDPSDASWQAKQTQLLQLSTHSQQLFADQSGHNIEIDQPSAAVAAIAKMVDSLRQP